MPRNSTQFDLEDPNRLTWIRAWVSLMWRQFRNVSILRSTLYFGIEVLRNVIRRKEASKEFLNCQFTVSDDPFNYDTREIDRIRFLTQTQFLDAVRPDAKFPRALEIGCAQGIFTKILADRCQSLLVADISDVALRKARELNKSVRNLTFIEWDLRRDPIPGLFDLIVAAGVLEYLNSPKQFRLARLKLTAALCGGGYLLVQSTRANSVVEMAWWNKIIIRGQQINKFIERDQKLQVVKSVLTESYAMTLFKKRADRHAT